MAEHYLSTEEVATILKITTQTVIKLTHKGSIPGYKVGRKILYKPEDISNSLKEISKPLKLQTHG